MCVGYLKYLIYFFIFYISGMYLLRRGVMFRFFLGFVCDKDSFVFGCVNVYDIVFLVFV